jgi:hypothetical protein
MAILVTQARQLLPDGIESAAMYQGYPVHGRDRYVNSVLPTKNHH